MDIFIQIEVVISSFVFGILFMILYDFFNRMLFYKKGKFFRFLLESIFFLSLTLLFFYIQLKISFAKLNIFIPLFIFLGVLTYIWTMQRLFLENYEFIFSKINLKIKHKKMFLKAKFDIIKMKYRKGRHQKHETHHKSKEKNCKKK